MTHKRSDHRSYRTTFAGKILKNSDTKSNVQNDFFLSQRYRTTLVSQKNYNIRSEYIPYIQLELTILRPQHKKLQYQPQP